MTLSQAHLLYPSHYKPRFKRKKSYCAKFYQFFKKSNRMLVPLHCSGQTNLLKLSRPWVFPRRGDLCVHICMSTRRSLMCSWRSLADGVLFNAQTCFVRLINHMAYMFTNQSTFLWWIGNKRTTTKQQIIHYRWPKSAVPRGFEKYEHFKTYLTLW